MKEIFESALADATDVLARFRKDAEALAVLSRVTDTMVRAFETGGKILACGNGGSLTDAAHFTEELTGRFRNDRKPYPAMTLNDSGHMSCVANDYGYDFVFSRLVEALGAAGDVLLLLSTSGESQNLIEAAKAAHTKNPIPSDASSVASRSGIAVVGFLGRGGGRLGPLCDLWIDFPGETSDRIQELHMLCLHALVQAIETRLGHASR